MTDNPIGTPFATAADWRAWLEENHASAESIWVRFAKKASGIPSVTVAEAVDQALCYGWINAQKKPVDQRWWMERFLPRGPRSRWSKVNTDRVDEMTAQGLMRPAGLRAVEEARADGRWEAAYEPPSTATVPPDMRAALDAEPAAAAFFDTLTKVHRYRFLHRVAEAKRPQTRAARIEKFVAMLARGETFS
jgi:uncharacterized protein YdeI (YjbR/CyaY-like superfamily)